MRIRNRGEEAKLQMTPMIDVVFQLLIFFIVTLKTPEILSHLGVSSPGTDTTRTPRDPDLLTIQISADGWVLNGRGYSGNEGFATLERDLARMASFSQLTGVVIKCTPGSPHSSLIRTLNACTREGLVNVSVFSL